MDGKQPQDEQPSPAGQGGRIDLASRRRFTRAGLSGSVLLGSLASKPVLGAVPVNCTVSGQVSGNLSRTAAVVCDLGDTPAQWQALGTWFDTGNPIIRKGGLPNNNCNFSGGSGAIGTVFNGFVYAVGIPALANIFYYQATGTGGNQACSVVLTNTGFAASMHQILASPPIGDAAVFDLGRAVIASLLNVRKLGANNYPVSPHAIVQMFNSTVNGSLYYPIDGSTSAFWDRARVIQYLRSLYQP